MPTSPLKNQRTVAMSRMMLALGAVALSFFLGVRTAGDVHTLNERSEAAPLKASLLTDALPGDMDKNNKLTVQDAISILEVADGLRSATPEEYKAGDLDHDGKLTIRDALRILKTLSDQ